MASKLTESQQDFLISKLNRSNKLTPSGVLDLARAEDSPLHTLFVWDDSAAAHQYRLEQARRVIKRCNYRIEKNDDLLVHIPTYSKGEGEYRRASTVVANISDFEAALTEAYKRLRAAERAVHVLQSVAHKKSPDRAALKRRIPLWKSCIRHGGRGKSRQAWRECTAD